MNNFLIKTPNFSIQKLIFELVKPKNIYLKLFSLQKFRKVNLLHRKSHKRCSLNKVCLNKFTKFT